MLLSLSSSVFSFLFQKCTMCMYVTSSNATSFTLGFVDLLGCVDYIFHQIWLFLPFFFFALSLSSVLLGLWWLWIYIHCTPYVDPEVFKTVHSFLFSFSDCIISLIYLQVRLFFFLPSWVCCWTVYWVFHFNYNTLQLQNF